MTRRTLITLPTLASAALLLASCVTDAATSRALVATGAAARTTARTYVCYDKEKDLVYGEPRDVGTSGCLGEDRRVTAEEAAQLKKAHWLARPVATIMLGERACRDAVADRAYALPMKTSSGVELKCVKGDQEITHDRAAEMVRVQRLQENRSASTEQAARENLDVVRRMNQALTERRFADVDRMVAAMQSAGEMVTAINWLGRKIDDGAGAAYVRAYVALVNRSIKSANNADEMKDLAARMSAYLYLLATVDMARCSATKDAAASIATAMQEAKPSFDHLASVSRERRDAAIAFAVSKEFSLAQRRGNDAWVCRYDAATTPAGSEIYADEATARQQQAGLRLVFAVALRHILELMVHDSARL